jgi:hypothetical protein
VQQREVAENAKRIATLYNGLETWSSLSRQLSGETGGKGRIIIAGRTPAKVSKISPVSTWQNSKLRAKCFRKLRVARESTSDSDINERLGSLLHHSHSILQPQA